VSTIEKLTLAADVEGADLERRVRVGEEFCHLILFPRIKRAETAFLK
jgi:hypothetical protein